MGDPVLPSPEIADGNPVLLREPFSRLAESLGCGVIYDPDSMRPPRPKYQDDISMHLSKLRPEGLPPSVTFEFPTELVDSTDRYRWAERVLMAWSGIKYLSDNTEKVYPEQVLRSIGLDYKTSKIPKAHDRLIDIYPTAFEIIEGCIIPEEDLSDADRRFLVELKNSGIPYTIYSSEYSLQYGAPINEKARIVNVVYRAGRDSSGYYMNHRVIIPKKQGIIGKISEFAHHYKQIVALPPLAPPHIVVSDSEWEALLQGSEIYVPRYHSVDVSTNNPFPPLFDRGGSQNQFIQKVFQMVHQLSYRDLVAVLDKELSSTAIWSPKVQVSEFQGNRQFWGLFEREMNKVRHTEILSIPGILIRRNALNEHNTKNKNPNILMQGITYRIEIPLMHLGRPVAAIVINIGLYVTIGAQSRVVQVHPLVCYDESADTQFKADLDHFSKVSGVSAQSARHREYWNRISAYRGGLVQGR